MKEQQKDRNFQERALEAAKSYAAAGDPRGWLENLSQSRLLEGLKITFANTWNNMSDEDIDEAIALAVDRAYSEILKGKKIIKLGSWLWKVTSNCIADIYRRKKREELVDPHILEETAIHPGSDGLDPDHSPEPSEERDLGKALQIARKLLPRIGQENVQRVMEVILDAAENGVEDLSATEIGDILDLNPATVRKCQQRGFQRLERIVKQEGLAELSLEVIR